MFKLKGLEEELLESQAEVIIKRNRKLHQFFGKIFPKKQFMIIGDPNKPAVVYIPGDKPAFAISCYVHNFTLIFTNKPFGGEHVYSITLNQTMIGNVEPEEIREIINNCEHRPVYRIKIKSQNLYLSGYNFLDKNIDETKYPVFSKFGSKIYFNRDHAEELADQYAEYQLMVVDH